MRRAQNRVRNARVSLGQLQQVITTSVKGNKGNIFSVLSGNFGHALEVARKNAGKASDQF
eukprot:scaffold1068_cov167-Amphora_coffeaeformis.AAC.19